MHKLSIWVCGIFAACALFAVVRPIHSSPFAVRGEAKLGGAMETIDASVKSLQAALKNDGDLAASLPDVWKAQEAVLVAKAELPKMVSEMTDPKAKHKAEVAYRTQMQDLLRSFLDVELALINGDAKKAEKALRATDNFKSAGHSQFRPRDGK